jgi:hypothetical protein
MQDPRMLKLMQQMMSKRQSPDSVVAESDIGEDMKVESPDQEYELPQDIQQKVAKVGQSSDDMIAGVPGKSYETSPEIMELMKQLGQGPSPSESEVAPESIDMKKAALEKIKQKYLGR